MNNYYEFNNLSTNILSTYLNNNFNYIESYLEEFSNVFKAIFYGQDYDEFYYACKSLIEVLNDIKIILNILRNRDNE